MTEVIARKKLIEVALPLDAINAASATRLQWKGKPILQFASVGSFAEMMVTSENGVVKIPEEMPMAEASLIGCGVMTGVGAALFAATGSRGDRQHDNHDATRMRCDRTHLRSTIPARNSA